MTFEVGTSLYSYLKAKMFKINIPLLKAGRLLNTVWRWISSGDRFLAPGDQNSTSKNNDESQATNVLYYCNSLYVRNFALLPQ